jgi:hypothetical protein
MGKIRLAAAGLLVFAMMGQSAAGEAEIAAAQATIDNQMRAFKGGDDAAAYSYAAPAIKGIFPTVEHFMGMVAGGYAPLRQPQSWTFGRSEETGSVVFQQVLVVGPDGKTYEAMYQVERQPDGAFLIKGVSMRASNALST